MKKYIDSQIAKVNGRIYQKEKELYAEKLVKEKLLDVKSQIIESEGV